MSMRSKNSNDLSTTKKTVSTATMTNSIDESIERVVRKYCKKTSGNETNLKNSKQPISSNFKLSNGHPNTLKFPTDISSLKNSLGEARVCLICGKNDKNELITCSICRMSGHSTCLDCSESLFKRIKELPNWECPNCKKCPVCGVHDDETNIVCVVCDRAFHRSCLQVNPSNSGKNCLSS